MNTEKEITKILKALANPRRLQILAFLKKEKEAIVSVIAQQIKLSIRSTSKHLSILHASRIIQKEQKSLEVYCSLGHNHPKHVKEILDLL